MAALLTALLAVAAGCAVAPASWVSSARVHAWAESQEGLGASAFDELWIVERSSGSEGAVASGWRARDPATGELVDLPVTRAELRAEVLGRLATVVVRQGFENPFPTAVEGEYSFPLPGNAAVSDFVVTIGERNIRAIVREREEARRIYQAARAQGLLASLLHEESPGRFTHRVANLAPRTPIEVRLEYFHGLEVRDGWCELVLPVPRDREHRAALEVSVDAGVPISAVESSPRAPRAGMDLPSSERLSLQLRDEELGTATEFRLRYQVRSETAQVALLGSDDADGGTFCLLVYPRAAPGPADLQIDWGDLGVRDVYSDAGSAPGEARVFLGRYRGGSGRIRLRPPGGNVVTVELQQKVFPARSLARTWARARIDDLLRQAAASDDPELASRCRDAVRELALAHGLSSFLTSLVMVDARS